MAVDHLRVALLKSRRLAIDLASAQDGGSIHVVKQIESLRAEGHEVDAFTRSEALTDLAPVAVEHGFRVWQVGSKRSDSKDLFSRDFEEGQSYVRGVMASPGFAAAAFDLIQIHHWTSGVGIYEYLPESLPIVFTPHLLPTEKARAAGMPVPARVSDVEQRLLARANVTVALSEAEREACLRLGARRVELVPNGVSEGFFELLPRRRPDPRRPLRLGSVGRICVQKGTDVLLDAVEHLMNAGMQVQLEIIGPSYAEDAFEAAIKQRVFASSLASCVCLLGPIPHLSLPSIVADWDIYLQPSRYESQGIALLEAMAGARCIVATRLPAISEFLDDASAHLVSAPPTGEKVANAVLSGIRSSKWEDRVRAARSAAQPFSWPRTTFRLHNLLTSVASESAWGGKRRKAAELAVAQATAANAATRILAEVAPAGILLLGSAARGTTRPGSDVDLLVLRREPGVSSQSWQFTEGPPVDVRSVSVARIRQLCEMSNEDFAEATAVDPLADYLHGAKNLTDLDKQLADWLLRLQMRRLECDTKRLISERLFAHAEAAFVAAEESARTDAVTDAQMSVNSGVQLLLKATLVAEGWIMKGAKRRPEAAVLFSQKSAAVRSAVSLLTNAVGIAHISLERAGRLVTARTQLRIEHSKCLERLGADPEVVRTARRHAEGATDYYSSAITNGYVKGCINHMRALSGVPLMPMTYARYFGRGLTSPGRLFLSSTDVTSSVKELWLEVMEPQTRNFITDCAERGKELSQHPERT